MYSSLYVQFSYLQFTIKSHLELIDTVDVRFHRCRNNIRIGTKPIINMIIVFHLHMYLTHIIATLADSLDGEFLNVI